MRSYGPFALLLVAALVGTGRAEDTKEGAWIEMFNGKDLTGWVIDGPKEYKDKTDGNKTKPLWVVEDKMIRTAGAAFGFLRYDRQFSDFLFHAEYRMVAMKDVNSGIGIRTRVYDAKQSTATRPSMFSYEVQLLDDSDKKPDKHCTGSLYRYVAPKVLANKPAPEWNIVEIECIGPKIRTSFNGTEVLNVDQSTIDEIKNKPLSGFVCLQSHSKQVEFRNVKIKEIKK
jgi:Domain of Unknown Function (DUF1080)